MKRKLISPSPEATQEHGRSLGAELPPNSVVALFGELGAGKTAFAKGLVSGIANIDPHQVNSPTFTYMTIYDGVFHFDLYRLKNADDFLAMGFEEYFTAGGICCIEWSERIETLLPSHVIRVTLSHVDEETREIIIERGHLE